MKKRLYLKFIAAYMILAVVELLVITSLGQQLVFDALVKNRAEGLYAEAGKASSLRVSSYFSGDKSAESTYASLSMAALTASWSWTSFGPTMSSRMSS